MLYCFLVELKCSEILIWGCTKWRVLNFKPRTKNWGTYVTHQSKLGCLFFQQPPFLSTWYRVWITASPALYPESPSPGAGLPLSQSSSLYNTDVWFFKRMREEERKADILGASQAGNCLSVRHGGRRKVGHTEGEKGKKPWDKCKWRETGKLSYQS